MSAIAAGPDAEPAAGGAGRSAAECVSSLEPSFRAQELGFAVSAIAVNIQRAVAAGQRTWWQQLLGRQPDGAGGALASAEERAGARVDWHSVWLHNSVRGAVALGMAVLVADLTGVQHSFWVVQTPLTNSMASRRARPGSSSTQPQMNSAPVSDPAGRPACSAKTRAWARLRAKDPGLTMYGIQTYRTSRPGASRASGARPPR